MILKKRLMQQLPALLMLTTLCGVSLAQEVQEDAGQFDRFLMAIADCKISSTKVLRVSCIIEQVFSPVKERNSHYLTHHFNWQVDAYVTDQFKPSTMAQSSELTVGLWKSQGHPNAQPRVSKSLKIPKIPYQSTIQVAKGQWTSQVPQRKLLAAGVLPMPTCTPTLRAHFVAITSVAWS